MTLELGVPGQIMPPASAAVKFAKRSEDEGFDAVWHVADGGVGTWERQGHPVERGGS